jgi:hypothetical protein
MSAMHLVHRLLFAAAVLLVTRQGLQLLISALLTMFFAVLFYSKAPYYSSRLNVLQTVLYTSVLFQLGFGACYEGIWNGAPGALVARGGVYYSLYRLQAMAWS